MAIHRDHPDANDSPTGDKASHGDAASSMQDKTLAGTHDHSDPASATPGVALAPGTMVGRYVVLDTLGAGAMGVVYTARDPELDRVVALKLLRPRAELEKVQAGQRKLVAEAQALARLNHPNVVAVFDVGVHEGLVFVAMELVDGATLGVWLAETQPKWPDIAHVMVQAGRGLAAAHAADLVHRDFKPDNIMIGRDGRVRVMDFGLARAVSVRPAADASGDAHASANLPLGGFVGTPAYCAPEQLLGRHAKASADQFSFCVTLWEALLGRRPFVSDTIPGLVSQVFAGSLAEPTSGTRVPAWLRRSILRGLAYEPAQRWPSMDALVDVLARGRTRARWRGGLAVLGSVALAGVGVAVWRHYEQQRKAQACADAGAVITESWDDARAIQVREALVATGVNYAEATASKVIPRLEARAQAWRAARTDACMQADLDGTWDDDTIDRSAWCFDERRMEFESLVVALQRGERSSVASAVSAAAGLARLEPCSDAQSLARRPAPPPPGYERDEIRVVRDDLLRAVAFGQIGAQALALDLARSVVERAQALRWGPLTAQARLRVGRLLEESGDYAAAEQELEAAYFDAAAADASEIAADVAFRLVVVVGERLARHTDAQRWARHQELHLARVPDPMGLREAERDQGLAMLYQSMGDHDEAKRLYEQAVRLYEGVHDSEHPDVLVARSNLATLLQDMGDYERAKAINNEALAAREHTLGPAHPSVGNTLNNLAVNYRSLGDTARARALYERALVIWQASLGPEHPHVAQVLNNLGNLLGATGDLDAAADFHGRALTLRERVLGPDHPQVAQSLSNVAVVRNLRGDHLGARALLERALVIEEKALGPEHWRAATTLGEIGNSLGASGDLVGAEQALRRALPILERTLGPTHPGYARDLQHLADVLRQRGELDEAQALSERALAIWDTSVGFDQMPRGLGLLTLAEIAADRGRRDEALRLANEALALRTRLAAPPLELAAAQFAIARFTDDTALARQLVQQARATFDEYEHPGAALIVLPSSAQGVPAPQ